MRQKPSLMLSALALSVAAGAQNKAAAVNDKKMFVRRAEIEVYPGHQQEYLALADEVDRLSAPRLGRSALPYPLHNIR